MAPADEFSTKSIILYHCNGTVVVCQAVAGTLNHVVAISSMLTDTLVRQRGFAPDYGHLTVFGLCEDCHNAG